MKKNSTQGKQRRNAYQIASLVMLVVSIAAFLYFLFTYISENTLQPGPYQTPPISVSPTSTFQPTSTPSPSATPEPTPSPTPYVKLAPVHLYFPNQSIDMEVKPVGRDDDGHMGTIGAYNIAAWYSPGPAPGDDGNALINGHVRWKGKLGLFSILPDMKIGDPVVTEHEDGSTRTFYVVSIDIYPLGEIPDEVMSRKGERRVTLITCNGEFSHELGTSVNRCVVVCKLAEDIENFDPNAVYEGDENDDVELIEPDALTPVD